MTDLATTGWRDATLAFLVDHRANRAADLADELVATIERDHAAYRRVGVVSHEDLTRSCRANLLAVLDLMVLALGEGSPRPAHVDATVYAPARETGGLRAEQGLPLDDVLRSFRIGGRLIWDDLVAEGGDLMDGTGLREIGSLLWEAVDATSGQVAAAYHQHQRSRVRQDEQRRAMLWEGVLEGRARDAAFALEAAGLLDLPPAGDLLLVVADSGDPTAAERAVAPHAAAFTRRGDQLVGVVALREDRPDAALADLARFASGPEAPRLAVSSVVTGLGSADDAHRQAQVALHAAPRGGGMVRYDDVLPEALLVSLPEVADRLVERWVAPITALGEEGDVLLATLSAWVSTGGSASRAAPLVPCHRNTVLNRVRRVSQVTGLPLDDDAPPVDLDLALRAHRLR